VNNLRNILHLHPYLNIDCGITEVIHQIASDAVNNRHYILAFGGTALDKFRKKNINVTLIDDGSSSKLKLIRNIFFIKNFIKKYKINIVHSHHRYFDVLANILQWNSQIKTITSVQSIVRGWKYLSYKADVLIAPSKSVKKHLISYFHKNGSKIEVIYNSIDLTQFEIQAEPEKFKLNLGLGRNTFIVGYAGRLDFKEKGVDLLINSFKDFNLKYPDSRLVLIGRGKDETFIKKFFNENNLHALIINPVTNLIDYINIFNILVLPSRIDPFPITMLLCGAAKIPFIGSSVDGIEELIRNEYNGLLFEVNNKNDLTEKIEQYYKDKKLAESCALNLKNDVMNNYTKDNYLKKINEVYLL
jgi:L-malate glycosyltransferase